MWKKNVHSGPERCGLLRIEGNVEVEISSFLITELCPRDVSWKLPYEGRVVFRNTSGTSRIALALLPVQHLASSLVFTGLCWFLLVFTS